MAVHLQSSSFVVVSESSINRFGSITFGKKMNAEKTIVLHEAKQTNNHPPKQQTTQQLPSHLNTNKNGLPLSTQRALLANVARFHGLDDFARDTCDKNPGLFGERSSKKRRACQDKRRHFIEIYKHNRERFIQLCSEFEALEAEEKTQKPSSFPTNIETFIK